MPPDPSIAYVREARHRISEKCGHDPKKLIEYYVALQEEQYGDRLVKPSKPKPESEEKV